MVRLDGHSLTLRDVGSVCLSKEPERVELDPAAALTADRSHAWLMNALKSESPPVIYGVTTGVGRMKNAFVPTDQLGEFQLRQIRSHAAGLGDPLDREHVRAMMLLRANTLAQGQSGVRADLIRRILDMLNLGLHPLIPDRGSVGASGDLTPLAHMTAALIGEEWARIEHAGEPLPAPVALSRAGILPIPWRLDPKEGLALMNGTAFSAGITACELIGAWNVWEAANMAAGLTLEAVRGETSPFDPRLHDATGRIWQVESARQIRSLTVGSGRLTAAARGVQLPDQTIGEAAQARVQDAYSLRCAPQVHGAVAAGLAFAEETVASELNAALDNPILFPTDDGGFDVVIGGNFHGQPVGLASDVMAVALTTLSGISERRLFRLLDPTLSYGLPPNLAGGLRGLNTGLSLAQVTSAALVVENRVLSHPATADSIPTKGNQDDYNSMAATSAIKLRRVVANCALVVACELISGAQAISLTQDQLPGVRPGKGTSDVHEVIRASVPALEDDRPLSADIERIAAVILEGGLSEALWGRGRFA